MMIQLDIEQIGSLRRICEEFSSDPCCEAHEEDANNFVELFLQIESDEFGDNFAAVIGKS